MATPGERTSRLILVGDAGERDAAVLAEVGEWASRSPERTLVIYLGDNMYPEGMTRRRSREADSRLLPQIDAAVGGGARVLFVPGNHDWADGGGEGYEAVLEQARYLEDRLPAGSAFLPGNGCPGPVGIDYPEGVRVIALDTQWFLHSGPRPTDRCAHGTPADVEAALGRLLETDRNVVIAAHHPLFGFGRHSGFSEWREHLFLPVIGSVVALYRKLHARSQDYGSEAYGEMTGVFGRALGDHPRGEGLRVWASGHEHSLQILEGEAVDYVLISGAGAGTTPVTDGPETVFAHSHVGFMVLDLAPDGAGGILRVVEPGRDVVFAMPLDRFE